MGVGLADDEGAVHRVGLAALVAGDDPRRYASGAQRDDEGRGEVFAEALAGVEQEIVHVVAAQRGRLVGVAEPAGAEVGDGEGRDFIRAFCRRAQTLPQFDGARVGSAGQL